MLASMSKDEPTKEEGDIKSLWATIANREARLLSLVEASAQIVWVTDKDGNVLGNPPQEMAHLTWSSFTGLSQESLRGHGWSAGVHPDDVPAIAVATKQSRQSGDPVYCEFRLRHKSGEWRWVICRGNAVRAPNGELIGWIGTCTDITAAKKTEEALRDAQQRLLAALEAGEMSTWIWRLTDNTFWWDKAGEVLWGLCPEDLRSHKFEDLLVLIHPEDRAMAVRIVEEAITTGVARNFEFRTLRPDGKVQWLSSRGRVEKDAAGRPKQVVGAFVDITRLKLAEETVRHAQKMQALGTLAGGIAHDFNNLLLAINGNARLALTDVESTHPSRVALNEILRASARATDLVRRILAFSSRAPRESAATPLVAGVREALNLVRHSVPLNITINTHFDDAHALVSLDETELHQVVINLVTNAAHAIGDQRGTIEVSTVIASDAARIGVRDTGSGMTEATLTRVFEPFFTTKPAGQGTGLGLAVVHGIVQGANGKLDVVSKPGVGSIFTVHLPIVREGPAAHRVDDALAKSGRGECILYVDDDDAVVFLIERTLRHLGYDVAGFTDAYAAVAAFKANSARFDIVVTDLSMPGMTGFDIARAIKQISAATPVVLTSGYVREQDRELAAAIGIDRVILKPNTIDELGAVLDSLCKQLKMRDA